MAVESGGALAAGGQGAAAGAAGGPWGAVAGAGLGILGSVIGGNAAKKAAAQAAAVQEANYQRNKALLEAVGIPSVEAQEIALKNPESVGDLVAELQGETGLKDIATDPQLRQNQMKALAEMQGLSETGLGTIDRIALDEAQTEATSADKSRRAALLSQMAQRGTLDSGASLAAQLQSSEAANQQAMQQSQNIAKQSATNRMNAITSLANQSGQMEQRDYGRQADAATAQDAIQRFNVGTRNNVNSSNLTNKQNIANAGVETENKQEMYNKGLLQQDYNNRMNKTKAIIGMNSENASNQASSAMAAGAGKANAWAQGGQLLGDAAKGSLNYYSNKADALEKEQRDELKNSRMSYNSYPNSANA